MGSGCSKKDTTGPPPVVKGRPVASGTSRPSAGSLNKAERPVHAAAPAPHVTSGAAATAKGSSVTGGAAAPAAAAKAASVGGLPHGEMLAEMAEKGLEFFESDKLEAMQETASKLMSAIESIPLDDPTIAMFKEAYAGCYEVIQTVANLAIPPPGGQIVGAALVITAMIIKGALNVRACRELGLRINKLLPVAIKHRGAFERSGEAERHVMHDFFDCCQSAQDFIKGVLEQNFIIRTVTWGSTKDKLAILDEELAKVMDALNMTATLGTFSIVEAAAQENARVQRLIDEKGGADALAKDEAALQQLIENAKGMDGVALSMQRDTHSMIQQLQASLVGIVADGEQGVHQLIGQENLKVLWRDCFKHSEVVPWKTFFSVFPQRLQFIDPEEIQLIQAELKDKDERASFQLAVDADNDDNLSVDEVTRAFPANVGLLEQVRELKRKASRKGAHYALPPVPPKLFGRDSEVSKLAAFLSSPGGRVAMVYGPPGEGKLAVAITAMRRLYEEGTAKGGAWYVRMDGVTTREQLLARLVERLCKRPRPTDKEFGSSAALSARLSEMAELGTDVLVLIDDCEGLSAGPAAAGDERSVREELTEQLVVMLRDVPRMRVVLASREQLDVRTLSTALLETGGGQRALELPLGQLATDDAVALIRSVWAAGSRSDAEALVCTFGRTPLMLQIVAHVIADGRKTCDQALQCGGIHGLADEDYVTGEAFGRVSSSVLRSLQLLPTDVCSHLLRLAMVLPGHFDSSVLKEVFDIRPRPDGDKLLKQLHKYSVTSRDTSSRKDRYSVTAAVREAAKAVSRNRNQATALGVDLDNVSSGWVKFVALCARLARGDFEAYRSMPLRAYNAILESKPNLQAALRFAVDQYDDAAPALPDLLEIVALLPYLAMVHDGPCVTQACDFVGSMAEDAGDDTGRWLCAVVNAHFQPSRTLGEQEELLEAGGLLDQACGVLRGSGDARAQWVLAMALRRRGVLLRDRCDYSAALAALHEAVDVCRKCDLKADEASVERILCLCELSGTMDYVGDLEHGIPTSEEAVEYAYEFYGSETAHPVTALALTTLGYHVKNKDHEQALKLHEQALDMRQKVLGKRHTEVALSLQQCGISLLGLGRHADAEAKLLESLSIRVSALGENHNLVANTQRQLADLYRAWARPSDAARHLRKMLSIGDALGWAPGHKKLTAAARDLAELAPEEASALATKYRLADTKL